MPTSPAFEIQYTDPGPTTSEHAAAYAAKRLAANRANAQHSTGPRTPAGKARAAQNSLRHGLTALSPVLPAEDRTAYDRHLQDFADQYQPANPTEQQLTRDLADTAWRINRIPALEADLLARAANPPNEQAAIAFDIVDAYRAINSLSTHGARLSRQFHNTLDQLREIQGERRQQEVRDMRRAAAVFQVHKEKGTPYRPADDGFVFSNDQIQRFIDTQMRHAQAKSMEYFLHYAPEKLLAHSA
jgi:hypothetical protein